jgi:transcriptional regulator with XRE-family HTH domain
VPNVSLLLLKVAKLALDLAGQGCHTERMLNPDQLADLLKTRSAAELADLSGLSVKTIYRLRDKETSPTLATVQRLLDALSGRRYVPVVSDPVAKPEGESQ